MKSKQYEELCRYFLADKLGSRIENIKSIHIPNPTRPGSPQYKHQIDLYWETGDELNLYLNIANAKWRNSAKVKQSEVILLQRVRQKVAARKAMMITNIGFTSGAIAVAKDEGIALHLVQPNFDYSTLSQKDSKKIQNEIQSIVNSKNESIYNFTIVHKAVDFNEISPQNTVRSQNAKPTPNYSFKVIQTTTTKIGGGDSTNRGVSSTGIISKGNVGGFTKGNGFSKSK